MLHGVYQRTKQIEILLKTQIFQMIKKLHSVQMMVILLEKL